MSTSEIDRLVELTQDSRFCMLTTVDTGGTLVSRPMARQDVDVSAELWFIATRDSRKVGHIQADPTVSVTVSTDTSWVSLAGKAEVVDVESAEYWDNPGGRVATVISLVKSKITGQPYDGGDHAKIADV